MKSGSLYDKKGVGGTQNVDFEIDDAELDKVTDCEVGSSVTVNVRATKGYTGNDPQIFIKKDYEQFFAEGICLDNAEVVSINGSASQVSPQGNLFPQGTDLEIKGQRNEV